jgi:hypothetical protein
MHHLFCVCSVRRPFSGIWSSPANPLPTGWIPVPCTLATSVFAAPITATDGTETVGAMLACSDGSLFDLTHNVALPVKGGPASSLVFGTALAGVTAVFFAAGATDSTLYQLSCSLVASGPVGCTAAAVASLPWGPTSSAQALTAFTAAGNASGSVTVWVSSDSSTVVYQIPVAPTPSAASAVPWLVLAGLGANASAYSGSLGVVALGNSSALTLLDAATGGVVGWDWVTDVDAGWGAPIDSPVTALAFGPDGTLYIGNTVCLNIRYTNGTYSRIDGPAGA